MTRVALSLLPIAALLLGSCDPVKPTAADGYTLSKTTQEKLEFPVRFVLYNNLEELAAAHRQALLSATGKPVPADRELQAFSILHASGGCTVHIVDPKKKYTPEWYGHEMTHCIYGEFHD